MADEPSLPRIPPAKAAAVVAAAAATADGRFGPAHKRVRLDLLASGLPSSSAASQLLSNSSDPAVFSSDDDPAIDNYAPGRRKEKKRYVGAWFAQHPASTDSTFGGEEEEPGSSEPSGLSGLSGASGPSGQSRLRQVMPVRLSPARPRAKKRTFAAADSGVWLDRGGDDNDDNDDNDLPDELLAMFAESPPPPPPPPLPHQARYPPPPRQRRVFQRVPSLAVDSAEKSARAEIERCIETGTEDVSLIGLGLTSLSNATVEPLSGLVPIPVVTAGVAFAQKDPELKIFLSNNHLCRLPGALFTLSSSLTVLSLRGNALTELPWSLGQLRALRSLNVSLNALRALPAELLHLLPSSGRGGHLVELLAHPNPFFTRTGDVDGDIDVDDVNNTAPPQQPQPRGGAPACVARSPVHYMDGTGRTMSRFRVPSPPPAGDDNDNTSTASAASHSRSLPTEDLSVAPVPPRFTRAEASAATAADATGTFTTSRVPTLLACALQTAYGAPQLPELPQLLPPHAPPHLTRLLERARAQRETGGEACAVCGRQPVVVPQTEWIEWWAMAKEDIHRGEGGLGGGGLGMASMAEADAEAEAEAEAAATTTTETTTATAATTTTTVEDVEVLPFHWRGCTWGCAPRPRLPPLPPKRQTEGIGHARRV